MKYPRIYSNCGFVVIAATMLIVLFALGFPNPNPGSPGKAINVQYVGWNSFIHINNIAEISNAGKESVDVRLKLHQQDGAVSEEQDFRLAPGEQRDIILNDLESFVLDSYGILSIESTSDSVAGRISYYRTSPNESGFDFVFSAPFATPISDNSTVSFNTYDPSGGSASVASWLSITNMSNSSATFVIEKRDETGTLVTPPVEIRLDAFARFDYEAGHVLPGPNRLGLLRIIPQDSSTLYLSNITRYGFAPDQKSFQFALQLDVASAIQSTGGASYAPIKQMISTSEDRLQNWLEVINNSENEATILVEFYDTAGSLIESYQQVYAPFAQQHFNASHVLADQPFGMAKILSDSAHVSAQSMFYIPGSTHSIADIYGSPAVPKPSDDALPIFSWNRYLGMDNYMTLSNPTEKSIQSQFRIQTTDGKQKVHSLSLPPFGTQVIELHQDEMGTYPDQYGTVTVENPIVIGEVLRVGRRSSAFQAASTRTVSALNNKNEIDFVNNTFTAHERSRQPVEDSDTESKPEPSQGADTEPVPVITSTPITSDSPSIPTPTEEPIETPIASTTPLTNASLPTGTETPIASSQPSETPPVNISSPFPDPSDAPAPSCPSYLRYCATTDKGELVCCGSRGNCDAEAKVCLGPPDPTRCQEGTHECGKTCCNYNEWCDEESSTCRGRCAEGESACPRADGSLGCCALGLRCQVQDDGTSACIKPPEASRCTPPQYACVIPEGDPMSPENRQSACCNPGATCVIFGDPKQASCCLPGLGPDTETGLCKGLGPVCGENTCSAGEECCRAEGVTPFCLLETDDENLCEKTAAERIATNTY